MFIEQLQTDYLTLKEATALDWNVNFPTLSPVKTETFK